MADEIPSTPTDAPAPATAPAAAPAPVDESPKAGGPARAPNGKFVAPEPASAPQPLPWSEQVKLIADEQHRALAARYTDVDSMAKAMSEFQKRATARDGWVRVPYENMPDEESKAWRAAAGVPEAPEKYALPIPEELLANESVRNHVGDLQRIAFEEGLSRKGMERVVKARMAFEQGQVNAMEAALAAEKARGLTELRQLWGADFERNKALALRSATWLGAGELQTAMEEIGYADHPLWIKAMAKLGAELAPRIPSIAEAPETAQHSLAAIQAEEVERNAKGTFSDPDFQRRRAAAYAAVHPGVVG